MVIGILPLVMLLGFGTRLSAQLDRATPVGTVSDSSGAVMAGAKVELVSQETGLRREVQTGANGSYTFPLVPIGVYTSLPPSPVSAPSGGR